MSRIAPTAFTMIIEYLCVLIAVLTSGLHYLHLSFWTLNVGLLLEKTLEFV
jgi:hypothetical protein